MHQKNRIKAQWIYLAIAMYRMHYEPCADEFAGAASWEAQ